MSAGVLWWSMCSLLSGAVEWSSAEGSPARLPPFTPSDSLALQVEREMMTGLLGSFSEQADEIFVGEVINFHHPGNDPIRGTEVIFQVCERIRGRTELVVTVFVPPPGDYVEGDPLPVPVSIVPGYQMLVFIDRHDEAIASNSLFLVGGGYLWRNKNESVFLDPVRDRSWTDTIDPSDDYVVYPFAEARAVISPAPEPKATRRRGETED